MQTQRSKQTPLEEPSLPARAGKCIPASGEETQAKEAINGQHFSPGRRLLSWRTLLPLVLVIVLLIYTAQKLHIRPDLTWTAMSQANGFFLLAATGSYYLSFPLRTLRWRLLLRNVGYHEEQGVQLPRFWQLVEILFLSWFANALVPAKLGDAYRAYLLRQRVRVSATRTFGTIFAERLLDLVALLLLFPGAALLSLREGLPAFLRAGLFLTAAVVLAGVVLLGFLHLFPKRIASILPRHWRTYFLQFREGTLGSFQRLPWLVFLTLAVWSCEIGRFFFILLALPLLGGSLPHLVTVACFIALGEALLSAIPFTSGGVGLVEGGMIALLALFTSVQNQSAAAVLLDRVISLLSVLLIGFVLFLFTVAGPRRGRLPAYK